MHFPFHFDRLLTGWRSSWGMFAAVVMASAGAQAGELTAKQTVDFYSSKEGESVKFYFIGLTQGISWANAYNKHEGEKQLYCQPDMLGFLPDQYFAILKAFLEKKPTFSDQPAGLVMVLALKDVFPCP